MIILTLPNKLLSNLSWTSESIVQVPKKLDEFAWHPLWLPPYCQRYKNLIKKYRIEE